MEISAISPGRPVEPRVAARKTNCADRNVRGANDDSQEDPFSRVSLFESQIAQLHCDGLNERVKSLAISLANSTSPSAPKTTTYSSASNGSHKSNFLKGFYLNVHKTSPALLKYSDMYDTKLMLIKYPINH